ncbi:MAG: NfeD family protein [Phycisphaeraceae bacterium]
MGNAHLTFAIVFLAIALVLFVVEWFIPSGGILAMCSLASLATGVVFLYKVDTTVGLIGAIVSLAALPFLIGMGLKILPSTPFFRMMLLKSVDRPGLGEHGIAGAAGKERMKSLVGEEGEAITDLRPVGTCKIKGQRMDCMASSGAIRAGAKVRVIAADGMQIKVKEEGT